MINLWAWNFSPTAQALIGYLNITSHLKKLFPAFLFLVTLQNLHVWPLKSLFKHERKYAAIYIYFKKNIQYTSTWNKVRMYQVIIWLCDHVMQF